MSSALLCASLCKWPSEIYLSPAYTYLHTSEVQAYKATMYTVHWTCGDSCHALCTCLATAQTHCKLCSFPVPSMLPLHRQLFNPNALACPAGLYTGIKNAWYLRPAGCISDCILASPNKDGDIQMVSDFTITERKVRPRSCCWPCQHATALSLESLTDSWQRGCVPVQVVDFGRTRRGQGRYWQADDAEPVRIRKAALVVSVVPIQ
jgi:hypothetical protein